jgi:hypothetical protein
MADCSPAGPRGGRPALLRLYDAYGGNEIETIQFADVYQIRRTVINSPGKESNPS